MTRGSVGLLVALACASPSYSQSTYGPFSQQGNQNGDSGNGASNGGNIQQQTGSGPSGVVAGTASPGAFNPTQIPSYSARNQPGYDTQAQNALPQSPPVFLEVRRLNKAFHYAHKTLS